MTRHSAFEPLRSPKAALQFVLFIGVVSFFADFTYEGSRSITGPLLAALGASAVTVGIVAGLGELLGYGLRLVSGPLSERTGKFWPITLFGYFIQMLSVPSLAFARTWRQAAALILVERIGKAIRNPPRDVMLSHAAREMGYGRGFGIHEALDQAGALFGPLLVAAMLLRRNEYRLAYETLLIPALLTLGFLLVARIVYPKPEDFEQRKATTASSSRFSRAFWLYLAGAALVAAGFADFSLVAFHFKRAGAVPTVWIPIFYSVAMAVSGIGSLAFGRSFDRRGIRILIPLTLLSAISAPLLFLGHFAFALIGAAVWGLGMGVHESIIPAAVATMVPPTRRPTAYGLFTGVYGVSWFLGSVLIGLLYEKSARAVVIFCVGTQIAAIPFFSAVRSRLRNSAVDEAEA
jgi:MFS family permease